MRKSLVSSWLWRSGRAEERLCCWWCQGQKSVDEAVTRCCLSGEGARRRSEMEEGRGWMNLFKGARASTSNKQRDWHGHLLALQNWHSANCWRQVRRATAAVRGCGRSEGRHGREKPGETEDGPSPQRQTLAVSHQRPRPPVASYCSPRYGVRRTQYLSPRAPVRLPARPVQLVVIIINTRCPTAKQLAGRDGHVRSRAQLQGGAGSPWVSLGQTRSPAISLVHRVSNGGTTDSGRV